MAPPTATYTETDPMVPGPGPGFETPDAQPEGTAPNEPMLTQGSANVQMQKFPSPPRFTDKYEEREYLKGRLALAFRIFGKYGFDEGVAGHITLRDPVDPHQFWVNPFGMAFSQIKSSDLILVNHEGKVIDGGPNRLLNQAAYMIHAAVHRAQARRSLRRAQPLYLRPRILRPRQTNRHHHAGQLRLLQRPGCLQFIQRRRAREGRGR